MLRTASAQTKINRAYCIMQQSLSQPGYERFVHGGSGEDGMILSVQRVSQEKCMRGDAELDADLLFKNHNT